MSNKAEQAINTVKAVGDVASVGVVVGAILEWLPAVAALFTIIWTSIRIYETDTVQGWLKRRGGD